MPRILMVGKREPWILRGPPSWLNQVERFFAEITRNAIRRGVFKSVFEWEAVIDDYLAKHNETSKPFNWTAAAQEIIEKVDRARETLNQVKAGTS